MQISSTIPQHVLEYVKAHYLRFLLVFAITLVGNALVNIVLGWLNDSSYNPFNAGEIFRAYSVMLLVFEGIFYINKKLDKGTSWSEKPGERLVLEIFWTSLWVLVLINVALYLITTFFFGGYYTLSELLVINTITFGVVSLSVLIYRARYFFKLWKMQHSNFSPKPLIQSVKIKTGTKNTLIPTDQIRFFNSCNKFTYINTFQSQEYLFDKSLDESEQFLDTNAFFRANRQFIINRASVMEYRSAENGKITVSIHEAPENKPIIISRLKASAFRKWIGSN